MSIVQVTFMTVSDVPAEKDGLVTHILVTFLAKWSTYGQLLGVE